MEIAAILILFVIALICTIRLFGSRIVRTHHLDDTHD